jgi:hypothetical protein
LKFCFKFYISNKHHLKIKKDAAKEKQRLLLEIARDKELRKSNKGVLPSVLGVNGYNPSILQYDIKDNNNDKNVNVEDKNDSKIINNNIDINDKNSKKENVTTLPLKRNAIGESSVSTTTNTNNSNNIISNSKQITTTTTSTLNEKILKIDSAIQTIMKYKTGGDGGQAFKLLITFLKNIAENPNETKFILFILLLLLLFCLLL